jgi:hypothetical protein
MFFVGSAPLSREGHINVSPKGLDTFQVLSETQVAYLDLTGSGNETSAHVLENGRITFMFCAFEGAPKILRLFGRGRVVLPGTPSWPELAALFQTFSGVRQIMVATITRVQTSCGFGVPTMRLETQRELLPEWAEKKGPEGIAEYRQRKNVRSIDGLPTSISPEPPGTGT